MALTVVAGPAGGGKGDWIAEHQDASDVVIDFTRIFNALYPGLSGAVRDDSVATQLRMAQWVKQAAIRHAAEMSLNGFITTADPSAIDDILFVSYGTRPENLTIIDPGREVVQRRLGVSQPGRDSECGKAIARWYSRI